MRNPPDVPDLDEDASAALVHAIRDLAPARDLFFGVDAGGVLITLTRNRAVAGLVPNPLAVEYYGQRASAGLIVTEASQVSQQGQGYQDTPGIYSKEQVAG